MEHSITFRHATINDLELLEHWDEQPHVAASDPGEEDWESELQRSLEWREYLIFEKENEPIGIVVIIDPFLEESKYWGDVPPNLRAIDIWIGEAHNLGKGYGTIMMNMVIDRIFSNPDVEAILIDPLASNKKAHRFYERLGFKFVEERTFDSDDCFVYELKREEFNS